MSLFCPYCLTQQAFNYLKCGHCDREVPRDYIRNARTRSPVWLATFGFPGHGKTNAINSMTIHIENLDRISSSAFYDYLDSGTSTMVGEIRKTAQQATVQVPPTPQTDELPEPLLIGLHDFPDKRSSTLVMYDLAGQAAVSPKENYVRAIQNAKTAWFVVSLTDLKHSLSRDDRQPRTINDLFMKYRNIMESLNVPLRGRSILVNYTKADLLIKPSQSKGYELPTEIREYVMNDPYYDLATTQEFEELPAFHGDAYRQSLEQISEALRDFTMRRVPGGRAFLNQAERKYGMKVEFCITSATGGKGNAVAIVRYRVLDPLLWAIYLNDQILDQTINAALIFDPDLYDSDQPLAVYNALSPYGANITSYHIGEKQPVFDSGKPPSKIASSARIPLIGPIVDSLDSDTKPGRKFAIALLADETPIDLGDFKMTSWEKRLHIITINPNTASDWPNRTLVDSVESDLGLLVDRLVNRLEKQANHD